MASDGNAPAAAEGWNWAQIREGLQSNQARQTYTFMKASVVAVGFLVAMTSAAVLADAAWLLEIAAIAAAIFGGIYAYAMYDGSLRRAFANIFSHDEGDKPWAQKGKKFCREVVARICTLGLAVSYAWCAHDSVAVFAGLQPTDSLWLETSLPIALFAMAAVIAYRGIVYQPNDYYPTAQASLQGDGDAEEEQELPRSKQIIAAMIAMFNALFNAAMIFTLGMVLSGEPLMLALVSATFAFVGSYNNTYYRVLKTFQEQEAAQTDGDVGKPEGLLPSTKSRLLVAGLALALGTMVAVAFGMSPVNMEAFMAQQGAQIAVITILAVALTFAAGMIATHKFMDKTTDEQGNKPFVTLAGASLAVALASIEMLMPGMNAASAAMVTLLGIGVITVTLYLLQQDGESANADNVKKMGLGILALYLVMGTFENITLLEVMGIYPHAVVDGAYHDAIMGVVLGALVLTAAAAGVLGYLSKQYPANSAERNRLTVLTAISAVLSVILLPVAVNFTMPEASVAVATLVTMLGLGIMGMCSYAFYVDMECDEIDRAKDEERERAAPFYKEVIAAVPSFGLAVSMTAFVVDPSSLESATGHASWMADNYPDELSDNVIFVTAAYLFIAMFAYLLYRVNRGEIVTPEGDTGRFFDQVDEQLGVGVYGDGYDSATGMQAAA